MRLLLAAAALVAAPLASQPAAPRLPTCIREASATAGSEMTRYGCAGRDADEALRFSVAVPTSWRVSWQDTADLVLTAEDGDNILWVVANDRMPRPVTRQDTLGFWRRATELLVDREVTDAEVEDFRDACNGRITTAREWLTDAQLRDSTLLDRVGALSVTVDGTPVLRGETEMRMLAGEPAGYLMEVVELNGRTWRFVSYATVRDGALFLLSFNTIDGEHEVLQPLLDRMLASFNPRTDRW